MEINDLRMPQRKEADRRIDTLIKKFNLNPHIKTYFNQGNVYYSYITALILGQIDTIKYDARYVQLVEEFEERTQSLVYHAIETGDTLALLYVSNNPTDWPMERLENNYIAAYVHNFANPECSECGDIFLDSYCLPGLMTYACLIRIA